MAQIIAFPVQARAPIHRARRVFQPQQDMERALRHAKMMLFAALLTTSLMMVAIHLALSH